MRPVRTRTVAGKVAKAVGDGRLVACLDRSITDADTDALVDGLHDWWAELKPAEAVTFVFRDGAFADDVAKANLAAGLTQRVPGCSVRSL